MHDPDGRRIFIIAGEASGDNHGAKLVKEIKRQAPTCSFMGIGGSELKAEGVDIIIDANQLSVVGVSEVLGQLSVILAALKKVKQTLKTQRPDLVILIDFPDFNLRVAKAAKQLGIKVLYYISPQLWAWRSGRIKTIKKYVDHMAVVFPFEVDLYQRHQVPVTYVGHPLANTVTSHLTALEARQAFQLEPDNYTVGLFPGSRKGEISRLLPTILVAAKRLKQKQPTVQFILPLASSIPESLITPYLSNFDFAVKIVKQRTYDVMRACDAAIIASGTVTLEAALMQLPMVVIYKISQISYLLGKWLIKIPYISLANIVAEEYVVPELIQGAANPSTIADKIEKLLVDSAFQAELRQHLTKVKKNLTAKFSEQTVAHVALSLLAR